MAWTLFLFMLLSYISGACSQHTLTQPPSQSGSLGQMTKLSCTISSNKNAFGWVQQIPGQAPRFLFYSSSRGTGVSDRFSVSESGNTGFLSIGNLQAEDEADYYCYMWPSGGSQYIFGGGTQLTVTGGPPSPPTVNLYCPSKEEMTSKGTGTLVCSITGFSPSAIETAWVAGGTPISNGVQTTKPIKDNDKYMASSYLPVTAREWERGNSYTCKVRHEEQDYMKSVSQSQCP